jgi:hypothetical protein
MRGILVGLAALVASVVLALTWAGSAPAASRSCGSVTLFGTSLRIVVLQGVTCSTAKRVTRGIHDGGAQRAGWSCALAHAPFDTIHGRTVAFSCGKGGRRGDLRRWPHAFVGTVALVPPAGTTPTR